MTDYNLDGLDMKRTLDWYASSGVRLPSLNPSDKFPYPVENPELIGLSDAELSGLFNLFPQNARDRSILRRVVGKPITWFHKNSQPGRLRITTERDEAINPTSFVPSAYVINQGDIPSIDVWMYKLPEEVPADLSRIVLGQGFVHEVGHTLVYPSLHKDDEVLSSPDGTLVSGLELISDFGWYSSLVPPISHYASMYRGKGNKFESDDPEYNQDTAIGEEMCEAIAAHLLGFAYCGDDVRGKNPLVDRPEVYVSLDDFLKAKRIK